jgi:hypothetical protein
MPFRRKNYCWFIYNNQKSPCGISTTYAQAFAFRAIDLNNDAVLNNDDNLSIAKPSQRLPNGLDGLSVAVGFCVGTLLGIR